MNPADTHLACLVDSARAVARAGAIRRFVELMNSADGEKKYLAWRADPVTAAFIDAAGAIASAGLVVPTDPTSVSVQYGVVCGAGLIHRLMDDPTSVFPGIFSGDVAKNKARVSASGLDPSYGVAPEDSVSETDPNPSDHKV